mgnify:CR=1 FL=1
MVRAVVDTNVIIYDYVEDSDLHSRAEEILDSLERWVIPAVVVYEFVWFLKGMGLEKALPDVLGYLSNEKAEVACDCPENLMDAAKMVTAESLSLSGFKDMVILSHAIRGKLPLATFDKKLTKVAKRYGVDVIQ